MLPAADQPQRLHRVVIVGGGTAGWITAVYLNRFMRRLGCQVVLVESPTLGTIGVGEATIPSLVQFVRALNLDEQEFMRRCSATYKLAIRFDGWLRQDFTYWHAFGLCGAQINGLDLFHYWRKRRVEAASRLAYSEYSLQARLCELEKSPKPARGTSIIEQTGSYAYHLDASAFAAYLREISTGEGVQHLFGEVKEVTLDERGNITGLDIGGDRTLGGDLFIDATGFTGRLIEQALGAKWIDWSHLMLCDRAVALPLPRGDRFPPYTLATAMPAGWTWRIPLNSRTGTGYVFSSAHISAEAAVAALIRQSGMKERSADPRLLKIRIGRRAEFWVRNCISVGLSSGFVEPLESTGIHLIQKAVELLIKYWPDRDFDEALRRAYNDQMSAVYDQVRDFIILHYVLAQRDEEFWRDARSVSLPESLAERMALYDQTGRIETPVRELFPEPSYFYILAGNERLPRRLIVEAEIARPAEVWQLLDRIRAENRDVAARMADHKAHLAQLHRVAL
ncbi:MAG TPA: tryptophan halogenase family protein [Stellaceae bacterium]|nr:tryptophan halogenase family protein [Stellaceae bacterium]